jgi:hypothetical protein
MSPSRNTTAINTTAIITTAMWKSFVYLPNADVFFQLCYRTRKFDIIVISSDKNYPFNPSQFCSKVNKELNKGYEIGSS